MYLFYGEGGTPQWSVTNAAWGVGGENYNDRFGCAVAPAGDVNGDGYADVIVGADAFGTPGDAGKAYVFHGSPSGLTGTASEPGWSATGIDNLGKAGRAVAGVGDVNGDGYGDIIVGSPDELGTNGRRGCAYLFHGSAAGITGTMTNPAWKGEGEAIGNAFGWALAGAGDVNGDGFADVLIGDVKANSDNGKVYAFHGSPAGIAGTPATADWVLDGGQDAWLGYSVAGVGDVNGDGYDDVAIGAPVLQGTQSTATVYVVHGGPFGLTGTLATVACTIRSTTFDHLGDSVAGAGDVNGDGYADVLAGAPLWNSATTNDGRAFVFFGGPDGITSSIVEDRWVVDGMAREDQLGDCVAGGGDIDGDGFSDLLVGRPGTRRDRERTGAWCSSTRAPPGRDGR